MRKWTPLARSDIEALLRRELANCSAESRALFDQIVKRPEKWRQSPWGDAGGGVWVVAVLSARAVWYNDIEDGFSIAQFEESGTIPPSQYSGGQDSLELALSRLFE